jgi:hypothetical protein
MAPISPVMISSTARDLPAHREAAKTACLAAGFFPVMMEQMPASPTEVITACLRMVDEATVYLGILAYRYGHVPTGHKISITEMEYNRAVERGIPRLIFVMDGKHDIRIADVEFGAGVKKLERLKARVAAGEQVVKSFTSPLELQFQILHGLLAVNRRTSPK